MASEPCYDGWDITTGLCATWGATDPAIQAWAERLAIFIVWAATGRQFGPCPSTVRPCWTPQAPLYQTWNVGLDGEGFWGLRSGSGGAAVTLLGGACGCTGGCLCSPSQVLLPGHVASVTSVTVDGVILDPSEYLVQGSWLVRAGGEQWPAGQDWSLPPGMPNTWSITYLEGEPVPAVVNDATGFYACELAKSKTGAANCQLPRRVQSVSRQGVEIQYVDTNDYLTEGLTGVEQVDQVIRQLNPYGLRRPPRVLSLDVPQYR